VGRMVEKALHRQWMRKPAEERAARAFADED
jgi:putative Mg2+ transporter-C (MgtC) family protein